MTGLPSGRSFMYRVLDPAGSLSHSLGILQAAEGPSAWRWRCLSPRARCVARSLLIIVPWEGRLPGASCCWGPGPGRRGPPSHPAPLSFLQHQRRLGPFTRGKSRAVALLLLTSVFFFSLRHAARGIIAPRPGIQLAPPAVGSAET